MWEGTGIGNPMVFWALRLFLLAVLIYAGYGISYRNPKNFKRYAWIAGVSYSLIEGLRWMRGADYYHYYNDIVTLFGEYGGLYGRGTITLDPEILYDLWVTGFYYSGLPFWIAFIFYSALLIGAFMLVLKQFPKTAIWALPFFFIITVSFSENIIRQYFATSFIFLAYYFYLNRKNGYFLLMLVIAPLIHFSAVIPEFGLLLLILLQRTKRILYILCKNGTLVCLLIIFLVTYLFWDSSIFTAFADFISNNVDMGENKSSIYLNNADRWLTDDGNLSLIFKGTAAESVGKFYQASMFLSFFIIIWGGFIAMRKDPRLFLPYYFSFFAIIIKNLSADIELYTRIYNWYFIFIPITIGSILCLKSIKKEVRGVILGIFLVYFFWYEFLSNILCISKFGYGFIWDANVDIWGIFY